MTCLNIRLSLVVGKVYTFEDLNRHMFETVRHKQDLASAESTHFHFDLKKKKQYAIG